MPCRRNPAERTARGYAIQPNVLPNQPDTIFDIASLTKMITAVAVLQLVAGGTLDLHTPLAAYNLDVPHAASITLHQVLPHTAGFGDYWTDAYRAARSTLRTVTDYLNLIATIPLVGPPGTRHRYSNTGYVVLGAVIEQTTGQSYFEYIRHAIYQPAGMHHSDHYALDLPVANRAIGYTNDPELVFSDEPRRANHFIYAVKGSPASNGFSTVQDLFTFLRALQLERLLDAQHLRLCWTPHVLCEQPGVRYGYGFHLIDDARHGRVIGHGGRAFGADALALSYADLGYTVIVLANYDRPAARQIVNEIADLLST